MKNKRLIGLDYFRIICVVVIFLFHAQMHLGTDFLIFNDFIKQGAIFMTGFFMLSGFVLYLTNYKELGGGQSQFFY